METPIAKLRNALSPIYGITASVLLLEDNFSVSLLNIVLKQAKQVIKNQESIRDILYEMEFPKESEQKTIHDYEYFKSEVARKYGLGKTLVTGHLGKYWQEAAELYANQFKQNK